MGAKGSSSYIAPKDETFKTSHYQKIYFDRVQNETKGFATPGQKHGIFLEVLKEERDWMNNMGKEYDEVIAASDAMDALKDG